MSNFESYALPAEQELPETMPDDSNALIERLRAGDDSAFVELWTQCEPYAVGAARNTGAATHHDSDDMAQETALKIWREWQKNPEKFTSLEQARGYIGRTAANTTVDNNRKVRRRPLD